MLPQYLSEDYEAFYARFAEYDEKQKEKFLRESVLFVPLQNDELEALVGFCADKNGIPYAKENINSLGPDELHEIIVAVCMEIGAIKIDLITETEKKKSLTSV